VAVTSGANMNFDRLALVAELASVGARAEAIFATSIPERPGAFAAFVAAALEGTDIQITEFKYRWAARLSVPISVLVCMPEPGRWPGCGAAGRLLPAGAIGLELKGVAAVPARAGRPGLLVALLCVPCFSAPLA
jgi:threonine dehydratase